MDPTQFDRLVQALTRPASRRATLATLLGSALAGALARTPAAAQGDASPKHGRCPAEKKDCHGRCIGKRQKCSKQGPPCRKTGQPCQTNTECCTNQCAAGRCAPRLGCSPDGGTCQTNSDCCAGTCFNQVCAAPPTTCSGQTCAADATGCCPGAGCCRPPANQCNTTGGQRGLCCAPNCANRQCGPDGCGNRGTCGDCPSGQTCNPSTGQCQGQRLCTPQSCPTGCCANGICQPGNTEQACGTGGQACVTCPGSRSTCQNGQCVSSCTPQNCAGCCASNGVCQPGTTEQACGTNGQACVNCPGAQSTCQNGKCVCVPQCQGKQCGDDGCGGSCGNCPTGQACNTQTGHCQPPCRGCPLSEECVKGSGCSCGLGFGTAAPFTCCPGEGSAACADAGSANFIVADTCDPVPVAAGCPTGYTPCVATQPLNGKACQACCPPGTTCDPVGGFCRTCATCP